MSPQSEDDSATTRQDDHRDTDRAHDDHHRDTEARRDDHHRESEARRDERTVERRETHAVDRARGGVSFWSILSGMFVAFGAFILIAAIVGAILMGTGLAEGGIQAADATTAGIAAAVGLVLAQFLAYLWGGYTAGRMARGSGVLNGVLVPVLALLVVAIIGGIVAAITGTSPDAAATEAQNQAQGLPLPLNDLTQIGTGAGIGLLVAMLLGGALGGWMGQRWHRKLEDREMRYNA